MEKSLIKALLKLYCNLIITVVIFVSLFMMIIITINLVLFKGIIIYEPNPVIAWLELILVSFVFIALLSKLIKVIKDG